MLKNKELIDQLSLAEKAFLLSGKSTWETHDLNGKVPALFMADGPHGLRKQVGATDHLGLNKSEPATCFPTAATLANSWDEELMQQVGRALGEEAQALNVQVVLGPGVNIKKNPLCGRNFEYYSEDPYLAGKLGAAIIRGIQENGTSAGLKHFAANNQEYRRMASNSIIDKRTLRELYTTNFEIAVKEGQPQTVMSSYNKINDVYANENGYLLKDVLRKEWGFDGFVVTDWGGDDDHVLGVKNGSNVVMPTLGTNGALEIIKAVEDGNLSEETIDQRIDEFLTVALEVTVNKGKTSEIQWSEHHKIAKEAALKSIVLLKNEFDILPLPARTKVAIVGDFAQKPRYQGAGSSMVRPPKIENALQEIKKYPLEVSGYAQGYTRDRKIKQELIDEAVSIVSKSEVALVFAGLDEISETEGIDRKDLKIPRNQTLLIERLIETGVPVVVVLSAGSVIECEWSDKVAAVVHGYLGGQAGASAMLDVLTGRYNPSGKLAETYPMNYGDVPFYSEYPYKEENAYYKEGLFVGYRYYESASKEVRFPFGYGLSYTSFKYADINVDSQDVSFNITNTGSQEGAEIAQLYVAKVDSALIRPLKELKGFAKVKLAAGETKKVTIPFDDKTFRYFDAETDKWEIENGKYTILIGSNVHDIQLEGEIIKKGKEPAALPTSLLKYKAVRLEDVTLNDFAALYGQELRDSAKDKRISYLTPNNIIADLKFAKNRLARLVYRYLNKKMIRSEAAGKPDLNITFMFNMPFRTIGKMTNGQISSEMVDALLRVVNGHFWGGLNELVKEFYKNRRRAKHFKL